MELNLLDGANAKLVERVGLSISTGYGNVNFLSHMLVFPLQDGNLKRTRVPEKVKDEQRALFFEYLLKTTPLCGCGRPNPDQIKQIQLEVIYF